MAILGRCLTIGAVSARNKDGIVTHESGSTSVYTRLELNKSSIQKATKRTINL